MDKNNVIEEQKLIDTQQAYVKEKENGKCVNLRSVVCHVRMVKRNARHIATS